MTYKEIDTIYENGDTNDCHYCCFALACINPCRLPAGKHYEEIQTDYEDYYED